MASLITAQLLFLEAEDPKKEIYLYINSPGGLIQLGLVSMIQCNMLNLIFLLCIGQAAQWVLLLSAEPQKIFSTNSRIMVHQPSAGFQGQATDIEIHANEVYS